LNGATGVPLRRKRLKLVKVSHVLVLAQRVFQTREETPIGDSRERKVLTIFQGDQPPLEYFDSTSSSGRFLNTYTVPSFTIFGDDVQPLATILEGLIVLLPLDCPDP
jgi:hypothetical protein